MVGIMEHQKVTIQQMKEALAKEVGSKFPLKMTTSDGVEIVRYIRGFADQQNNIALISETSYSMALKILEVRDIRKLEYAENAEGNWKVLYARWMNKPAKPLPFLLILSNLLFYVFQ
jgi:hypothetical protein